MTAYIQICCAPTCSGTVSGHPSLPPPPRALRVSGTYVPHCTLPSAVAPSSTLCPTPLHPPLPTCTTTPRPPHTPTGQVRCGARPRAGPPSRRVARRPADPPHLRPPRGRLLRRAGGAAGTRQGGGRVRGQRRLHLPPRLRPLGRLPQVRSDRIWPLLLSSQISSGCFARVACLWLRCTTGARGCQAVG